VAYVHVSVEPARFLRTARRDAWWVQPVVVGVGLCAFVVYSTWAAFQGTHYAFGNYLSPFYSPELFGDSPHSLLGPKPASWPGWLPWSPALLILWAPAGFRLTCYYYRGAYYKALWADPPSCTVGEPRHTYRGENAFPLVLQNVHRYFLYLALIFLAFLSYDAWRAMWFEDPAGRSTFGIGVGTLVLTINALLLGSYTLSCHSLRHLVGGCQDRQISSSRFAAYRCATCLNRRHMVFAWASLVWVGFTDLYVRMLSMGIWTDARLIGGS
jgi:hypothetical protein